MSFIQRWDVNRIVQELHSCASQVNNAYNDGFVSWGCKQDLYRVKFALEDMLRRCNTFAGEQEWLQEMEAKRTWEILKK